MPLIRFIKPSTFAPFGKAYRYEKDVVYDVIEGLAVKFCNQMGVAVLVESGEDAGEVQPNPSAEIYDSEGCVIRPGATPAPAPEAAPETESEDAPIVEASEEELDTPALAYSMLNRSGPWFDVIESATGQQRNEKPLRKSAAIALTDKLNGEVTDASSDL